MLPKEPSVEEWRDGYIKLATYAVSIVDENTRLRELAHLVAKYVSANKCYGCVTKRACNAGELDMCWIPKAILEKLRELGVKVDK